MLASFLLFKPASEIYYLDLICFFAACVPQLPCELHRRKPPFTPEQLKALMDAINQINERSPFAPKLQNCFYKLSEIIPRRAAALK